MTVPLPPSLSDVPPGSLDHFFAALRRTEAEEARRRDTNSALRGLAHYGRFDYRGSYGGYSSNGSAMRDMAFC